MTERYLLRQERGIPGQPPDALKGMRKHLRGLRRKVSRLEAALDAQLAFDPWVEDGLFRPQAFRQAIPDAPVGPISDGTRLGQHLVLHHDCAPGEVLLRQASCADAKSPHGRVISLETFECTGSYISLAVAIPDVMASDISRHSLVTLRTAFECEVDVPVYARLNLRNGPNTEQVTREPDRNGSSVEVVFDVHYTEFEAERMDSIWVDLIFTPRPMNALRVFDLGVDTRLRATL